MGQSTAWVGTAWIGTYRNLRPLSPFLLILVLLELARFAVAWKLDGADSFVRLDPTSAHDTGATLDVRLVASDLFLEWAWQTLLFVAGIAVWSSRGEVLSFRAAGARGRGHWWSAGVVAILLGFLLTVPLSLAGMALVAGNLAAGLLLGVVGLALSILVAARWILAVPLALYDGKSPMAAFAASATALRGSGAAAVWASFVVILPIFVPVWVIGELMLSPASALGDALVDYARGAIVGIVMTVVGTRLIWEMFDELVSQRRTGPRHRPPQP